MTPNPIDKVLTMVGMLALIEESIQVKRVPIFATGRRTISPDEREKRKTKKKLAEKSKRRNRK